MRRNNLFSRINSTETSISSIRNIPKDVEELCVLHGTLNSMEGVSIFRLKILNLSSNHIQKIQGIEHMKSLEQINLSNNKIRDIQCVNLLVNLQKLILFRNDIESLTGLKQLSNNPMNKLKMIDMRGNKLSNLNQLQILTGLGKLEEILFDVGKGTNPFCNNKGQYYRMLIKHLKSEVKKIDNRQYREIQQSVSELSKITEEKENKDVSNIQDTRYYGGGYQTTKLQIMQLQKIISYKDLIIEDLKGRNLQSTTQINQNYKEFLKVEHQLQRTQALNQELEKRNSKKDKQLQQIQSTLNDMMKENGKLSKQIYSKNSEMQKYIKQISEFKLQNAQYRAVLKDNQRKINDFQSKALQNVNTNSIRLEEAKRKNQKLYQQNSSLLADNNSLKHRVQELNEICRQWEFKYQRSYDQYIHNIQKQLRSLQQDHDKKIQLSEHNHQQQIINKQIGYKKQLDSIQVEFKAALLDLGQKYKKIKKQHEQLSKSDIQIKQRLKITLLKNTQLEGIVSELQGTLEKFRNDYVNLVREKQTLLRALQQLKFAKNEQYKHISEERDKLVYQRSYLERQLTNMKQKISALEMQLQHGDKVEELNTIIESKNRMLEDKNQTIQALKQQVRSLEELERTAKYQFETIRKKYETSKQRLKEQHNDFQNTMKEADELKQKNEELQSQLQTTKGQLVSKQQSLNKIQNYLNEFSSSIKQKDDHISQLLSSIQECKKIIIKKVEETDIYKKEAQSLKRQFNEKYEFYKNRDRKSQLAIQTLTTKIQKLQRQKVQNQKASKTTRDIFQQLSKHLNK